MSLAEGSMAAQDADVSNDGEASSSAAAPQGISFVKSIDRKARNCLKTIERSLSFSMTESKGEDSSTMTIEFLHSRLQAQRAEYKAEKQRSQLLAKKVIELEQRLSFEIEQRRKAEGNNMQVMSSNFCGGVPSGRPKHRRSNSGRDFLDSKLKNKASGEDDPRVWCPEIVGVEDHLDGDGAFLISPSAVWDRRESLRRERQTMVDQHAAFQFYEGINAAEGSEESFALAHRDIRPCDSTSCGELALSMEVLEDIADQASAKCQITRQASAVCDADRSLKWDCCQQHTHISPYMRALYPEGIRDNKMTTCCQSSHQAKPTKIYRSSSDMEARYAGKSHIRRMSLDGSIDIFQKK